MSKIDKLIENELNEAGGLLLSINDDMNYIANWIVKQLPNNPSTRDIDRQVSKTMDNYTRVITRYIMDILDLDNV